MNSRIVIPAFILMVLVQLYVPANMIFKKESVLTEGKEFRFRTRPIDPSDPFRGKYVVLSFQDNAIKVNNAADWYPGEEIYVSLTTNEEGFAKIQSVSKDQPMDTEDYVKSTIEYIMNDSVRDLTVYFPFDRYYMEESKAYNAELAYNEATLDTNQISYALVSVKKGDAVIKDVIIDGIPIREAAIKWQEEHQN